MKVVQEMDIDSRTVEISEGNKLRSVFRLTNEEFTVPLNRNDIQLVFRTTENCNYPFVCTGIQYAGTWYGDRPDDGEFTNPITNEVIRVQGTTPQLSLFQVVEGYQGLSVRLINFPVEDKYRHIVFTKIGGVSGGEVEPQVIEGMVDGQQVQDVTYNLTNTLLAFSESIPVEFTMDGQTYSAVIPRVNFDNGLGTYAFVEKTADVVMSHFNVS